MSTDSASAKTTASALDVRSESSVPRISNGDVGPVDKPSIDAIVKASTAHTDYRDRLLWLSRLRWWAMIAAMGGVTLASALKWPFVNGPAVVSAVAVVVVVNLILLVRCRRAAQIGPSELWLHAVTDLAALTWMLASAGGLSNPMTVLYSFHVVLGALLTGRAGTLVALTGCISGSVVLLLLELFGRLPSSVLDHPPPLLSFSALIVLVGGLSYFAVVLAGRLRAEEALAHAARARAEGTLGLLQDSLDRLKVGLEVFGPGGQLRLQSPFAQQLRAEAQRVSPQQSDLPIDQRREFSIKDRDEERLFDVLTLAPDGDQTTRAVLYVDRTEERVVQQRHIMLERLATLGRALQGVAHELNTPLTTMQTLARDLSAAVSEIDIPRELREDIEESIELLIDESRRCRTLTQSLLNTAHEEGSGHAGETLLDVARRAVRVVGLKADGSDRISLAEQDLKLPLPVDGDRVLQILMNLVQNALKATEELGPNDAPHVEIGARHSAGRLEIVIADRGPGLPAEVRERLFEPFVTTRPMGEGTGLGLYTAHRIAHELGGDLQLLAREGGGTEAVLYLREG